MTGRDTDTRRCWRCRLTKQVDRFSIEAPDLCKTCVAIETRTCRDCGETRPLADFPRHAMRSDGTPYRRHICRTCHAAHTTRWKLGLSDEAWSQQMDRHCARLREARRTVQDEAIATLRLMLDRLHERGYSDRSIAGLAGCSRRTLWRWRHGEPEYVTRGAVDRVMRVYLEVMG